MTHLWQVRDHSWQLDRYDDLFSVAASTDEEAQSKTAKLLELSDLTWDFEGDHYVSNRYHKLERLFNPYPETYIPQCFLWAYVEGQLLTLADRYYTKLKQHHAAYGVSDQTAHLKWLVGAKLSEALRTELLETGRLEGLMEKNPDLYDAIIEAQERDKGWRNVLIDWSGDRDAFNTAILYPVLYPDLLWQEIVK